LLGATTPILFLLVRTSLYGDGALTILLHSGSSLPTGKVDAGSYTYYLNDSAVDAKRYFGHGNIINKAIPSQPQASDNSICFEVQRLHLLPLELMLNVQRWRLKHFSSQRKPF